VAFLTPEEPGEPRTRRFFALQCAATPRARWRNNRNPLMWGLSPTYWRAEPVFPAKAFSHSKLLCPATTGIRTDQAAPGNPSVKAETPGPRLGPRLLDGRTTRWLTFVIAQTLKRTRGIPHVFQMRAPASQILKQRPNGAGGLVGGGNAQRLMAGKSKHPGGLRAEDGRQRVGKEPWKLVRALHFLASCPYEDYQKVRARSAACHL